MEKDNYMKGEKRKSLTIIRIGIVAAGIMLVAVGIRHGDYADVMNKAIRICYECIGIG